MQYFYTNILQVSNTFKQICEESGKRAGLFPMYFLLLQIDII